MTNEMIDSFRNIRVVKSIPKKFKMIVDMDTYKFIVFMLLIICFIKIFV